MGDLDCTVGTPPPKYMSFGISSDNKLYVCNSASATTTKPGSKIEFDSSTDLNLYQALSLTSDGILNIFSASAEDKEKGGTDVFEMAYYLLDNVCDDIKSPTSDEIKIVCRKAMLCFSYYRAGKTGDIDSELEDPYGKP